VIPPADFARFTVWIRETAGRLVSAHGLGDAGQPGPETSRLRQCAFRRDLVSPSHGRARIERKQVFLFHRLIGKPRSKLDIDLNPGHPSPETRIWDRSSGLVVDDYGPMQDVPWELDS
jgi:hypothetical protein